MNYRLPASLVALLCAAFLLQPRELPAASETQLLVLTTEGRRIEGACSTASLTIDADGRSRRVGMRELLSFHSAAPATPGESARIAAGLAAAGGPDRKTADVALEALVDIGLPVVSPLLAGYKDTDAREPQPLYRLFGHILPGYADGLNRGLDLIRLAGGEILRGKLQPVELRIRTASGTEERVSGSTLRRLAVRRAKVERSFELRALQDCTYVSWLDTGVGLTAATRLRSDSSGLVRLSFDEDGWASDPDGIKDPLPGKRRLQEGFRWGAILGRVGAMGERWLVGAHLSRGDLPGGRLYFVINDNEHWQNNIGSFRTRLLATDAYDLGDPG